MKLLEFNQMHRLSIKNIKPNVHSKKMVSGYLKAEKVPRRNNIFGYYSIFTL